jgi:F0F1-type ATP synthase membrane subunit b/b'
VADDLATAARAYQQARAAMASAQAEAERIVTEARGEIAAARSRLAEAIVAAARDGMRQVDIVRATGYTRERVRQILRANGVEAD